MVKLWFLRTALALSAGLLAACGGGSSGGSTGGGSGSSGAPLVASYDVSGWASQGAGTSGGTGAAATNIYVVHNRAELKAALENRNSPTWSATDTTAQAAAKAEKKIIYIVAPIYGTDLGNGTFADEAYYKSLSTSAANWDWNLYIQSLDTAYMADLNTKAAAGDTAAAAQKTKIGLLTSARTAFSNIQKEQIQFIIPSNTTILGVGENAKIIDGYFSVNASNNIVVRNLEFQAPLDLAPAYDTSKPEWNARFKAFSMVTGKQVWIDHCTFSDGANLDTEKLTINGVPLPVMRHDGLLDIEDSSDYVTVSYSIFKNHDKTNMVGGSGDGNGSKERDFNRLTFSNNIWQDSVQRAPRARFGKIHVYNNSYSGDTGHSIYPVGYYIGMGAESRILSEANVFDMTGTDAKVSKVISNLNGYQFKDVGSWFNGVSASDDLETAAKAALEARWSSAQSAATKSSFTLAAYTNELGWTPPYSYTRGSSADVVRKHNLANSGAGKLFVSVPNANRPLLSDDQGAIYTVAKALAGGDAWAPQAINGTTPHAGRINPAALTADFVVAKDGSGTHATIQAALNAASTSTAANVFIKIKAGDYNEQLVVGNVAAAITLYSAESDASKVRIYNAMAQGSPQSSYSALVGATYDASVYSGNTDAKTVYNACMASGKVSAVGKECSTTIRVRNNGFRLVNLTVENAWVETGSNDQAVAVMIDKADKVVLDGVRLISNQDTLYLANSGKRTYVTGSDIAGDVDFIFGAGVGVFEGSTIRTIGTRKPSGTSIAAPATTQTAQTYGLIFNDCVFLADSATTKDSIFLARQWDDSSTDVPGKMIVRNSMLGDHIALTTGPWSATTINGAATAFANGSQQYLGEYHNWQQAPAPLSDGSTPVPATPTPMPTATPEPTATPAPTPTPAPITGNAALTVPHSLSLTPAAGVGVTYDGSLGQYTMVSAGKYSSPGDSVQMVYSQVSGNFTLTADLVSMTLPTGYNAADVTAGLIIRNSLSPTSQYYYVLMRGSLEVRGGTRLLNGGNGASTAWAPKLTAMPTESKPLKLKLVRAGQVITVSYSTDGGATWSTTKSQDYSVGATATPFDSSVYVGLVGGSGIDTSSALTSTSIFKNVSLTLN